MNNQTTIENVKRKMQIFTTVQKPHGKMMSFFIIHEGKALSIIGSRHAEGTEKWPL